MGQYKPVFAAAEQQHDRMAAEGVKVLHVAVGNALKAASVTVESVISLL